MGAAVGRNCPVWAAEAVAKYVVDRKATIFDCAAGTGNVAELLRRDYGFTGEIDALDGSQEMLDIAKAKDLYNNLYCCFIGGGRRMPIDDSEYDL